MKNNNEKFNDISKNFIGLKKKEKKYKFNFALKNPSISHFSIDSHFIYSDNDFISNFQNSN